MRFLDSAKKVARKLGLYKAARDIWRKFNPEVRAQKSADLRLYGRFISAGDTVFDIGANLGQKSEIFLELGAIVVAAEPNPKSLKVLQAQLGHHSRFSIAPVAVGSQPGTAILNFRETSSTASLRPDWGALKWGDGELEQAKVDVVTLDSLIAEHGPPTFCKIDVEGFELEVIRGLSIPIDQLSFEFISSQTEVISQIFQRLGSLGRYKFNIIAMNQEDFLLPDWRDIADFSSVLGSVKLPPVGDIFVSRIIE